MSDHMSLESMYSELLDSKKFMISQIPISELLNAYRIFGNIQSFTIVKAFQSFTRIINANCHTLTAKKNVDNTIDIRIPDYELWSLTKISQIQPFEIGHQIATRLYNAINIPIEIIEDEIEVLARYDELRTIKIRASLNLVLGTLGRQGFVFTPICNTSYHNEISNKALISSAILDDRISSRRRSIEEELEYLSLPTTPIESPLPRILEENETSPYAMRKRSRSETDVSAHRAPTTYHIDSIMEPELQIHQKRRLKKLQAGSLNYTAKSNRGTLKMISLLGFQPAPKTNTGPINLEATIEMEDKLDTTYRIRFTELTHSTKRVTPQHSTV